MHKTLPHKDELNLPIWHIMFKASEDEVSSLLVAPLNTHWVRMVNDSLWAPGNLGSFELNTKIPWVWLPSGVIRGEWPLTVCLKNEHTFARCTLKITNILIMRIDYSLFVVNFFQTWDKGCLDLKFIFPIMNIFRTFFLFERPKST